MIKILELFGGIGACSKALERLGIEYEIADYVEIDKYAVASFNAMHNTNFEVQDITQWNKKLDVDLIMHGSPCQDFSLAGLQAGGDEGSGTRSSLMYETLRIVKKLRPKYVIWENVKNLLSKKHRHNFDTYLETMEELGYKNYYQVLNAKDYGIPQNRERIFTISIRNDIDKEFVFPEKQKLELYLSDILEKNIPKEYYWNEKNINELRKQKINKVKYKWNNEVKKYIYNEKLDLTKVYSLNAYNNTYSEISHTLTAPHNTLFVLQNKKIRKTMPLENWRLMGFDDEDFEKASKVNSNSQLHKQAGNSIVVNVLEAILKKLIEKSDK